MKYYILIEKGFKLFHLINIFNSELNEIMYKSMVNENDILNFFIDLKIPIKETTIDISKGINIFFELKNIGYSIKEV